MAMIDVIFGGRVISGMVRGVGVETVATNANPVDNQERLEECHDLVIKTWTTPETAEWAASHGYTYLAFLTPLEVTEVLFDIYRNQAAKSGHDATPDNFGYLLCCYVAETQEKADEEARHFIWRMGTTTRGPREYMNPVDYRSRAGEQVAARRNVQPLVVQSFEELKENYYIVCGTPDTVLEELKYLHDWLGMDHLIMYGQESRMSHEATMANIGFFGKEVLPVIRDW